MVGAVLALAVSGAALAETLVVRAIGPSAATYPIGRPLPSNDVSLQAGDQLTILDGGATRTWLGPGRFTVGGASEKAAPGANFAALVSQRTTRIARTGAVRGTKGDTPPRSPNLWYIDTGKTATVCLPDFKAAVLWRADMAPAAAMTLTRVSDNKTSTVNWSAGQSGIIWPQDLPLAAGDVVRITRPGADAPTVVTFRQIRAADTPDAMAVALIAAGCTAQLDVLVASLAVSEDEGPRR
ncbi:MAG: hypothetical protein WCI21_00260 [Alphaproteobacteria bacterium]